MFDGMTTNEITTGNPIGLTAFINGTGGRWMTTIWQQLILLLKQIC